MYPVQVSRCIQKSINATTLKKAFKIIKNLRCKHEKNSTCMAFLNAPALAVIYEIKTVFRWTLCYVASYCCNCALAAIICILISMMHSWNSWYAIKATRMINLPYDHRINTLLHIIKTCSFTLMQPKLLHLGIVNAKLVWLYV